MGSEGFIQDPATKETKRFHRDEKSWVRDPKVFVDTGIPIPGEPPLLKTRVHLRRDAAEQLWKELQRVGWQQVDPCWGAFFSTKAEGGMGVSLRPCLQVEEVRKFALRLNLMVLKGSRLVQQRDFDKLIS